MIEASRPAPCSTVDAGCSTVTAGTLTIQRLAGRHGLLLDGEADLNSCGTLRGALHALTPDGSGEIHLDLARLTYIDVSCTRELVTLAQFARPARVILHNPPWALQRITALAWPQAGLEVTGAGGGS
jgi:anti-anti-sigma regulatory factor